VDHPTGGGKKERKRSGKESVLVMGRELESRTLKETQLSTASRDTFGKKSENQEYLLVGGSGQGVTKIFQKNQRGLGAVDCRRDRKDKISQIASFKGAKEKE